MNRFQEESCGESNEHGHSVTIPENINEFSLREAAGFYRDELGYAPHPLTGATSQGKARGKAPILKDWKQFTPDATENAFLDNHFGEGSSHNLGCVIRGPRIAIDLDSKADEGASVRRWLEAHPETTGVPRERTTGGVHLHYECPDVPEEVLASGSALVSTLSEGVTAELFSEGLSLVMSPSLHQSGRRYEWEVMGVIPRIGWSELMELFGFASPEPRPKTKPWLARYPEDLRTFDPKGFFDELELRAECRDTVKGKWAMTCPWQHEHSEPSGAKLETDTVLFKEDGALPGFKCLHAHCSHRSIKDVIEFAEEQHPGILSRHCSKRRLRGQDDGVADDRPQVELPGPGRSVTEFAEELVEPIARSLQIFLHQERVVEAPGMDDPCAPSKISGSRLTKLGAPRFVTTAERFVEVGVTKVFEDGDTVFIPKSMNEQMAKLVLVSSPFLGRLPRIDRILDVPVPTFDDKAGKLVYPSPGYNPDSRCWLDRAAPEITPMPLDEAMDFLLRELFGDYSEGGFCWRDEQARVHAIARLITPFCRGLMEWHRAPLWIFAGNREGCGKDTCADLAPLLYTGRSAVGAPLSLFNDEETRKRITSVLLVGESFFHMANMKGHVQSAALEALTDNSGVWRDRLLGRSEALVLRNELEVSFSANNASWSPDIERRCRVIRLHAVEENVNERRYRHEDLRSWIGEHRPRILSAVNALVEHWTGMGCPDGPTPFSSFPEWGRVVGGILHACSIGDPCLPCEGNEPGGDHETHAMREFFELAHGRFGNNPVKKQRFNNFLRQEESVHELFHGLDFSTPSGQISFAKKLQRFNGRILKGILFTMHRRSKNQCDYRFARNSPGTPPPIATAPAPEASGGDGGGNEGNGGSGSRHLKSSLTTTPGIPPAESSILPFPADGNGSPTSLTSLTSPISSRPRLTRTGPDLDEIAADLTSAKKPLIALSLDTTGPSPWNGEIRALSLRREGGRTWTFDPAATGDDLGPLEAILGPEGNSRVLVSNALDALYWLRVRFGLRIRRVICLETARRLLAAGSRREPSDGSFPDSLLSNSGLSSLHDRCASLEERMKAEDLADVWNLENRLLPVVAEMMAVGLPVDAGRLRQIAEEASATVELRRGTLREDLNDPHLDPDNKAALLDALKKAGLNPESASKAALKAIDDGHLVPLVLKFRDAINRDRAARSLLPHVSRDGRIHGRFDPLGTVTGRFSSKDPCLQNLPRGELRRAIAAPPGRRFVIADYAQVELRAAAAISCDSRLIDAFRQGIDPYTEMATVLYGKLAEEVTAEERRAAKTVSLSLLYGQGVDGLKQSAAEQGLQLDPAEAESLHSTFLQHYEGLRKWHQSCRKQAAEGVTEVRTLSGRRCLIPEDTEHWKRFTNLINTPAQAGCADGMKLALIALDKRLPHGSHLVLTVHDEVLVEVPDDDAATVAKLVRDTMLEAMRSVFEEVPFEVLVNIRDTWGD